MRLRRLTGLERDEVLNELAAVRAEIERLTAILNDEGLLLDVIEGELVAVREQYGDDRRTAIVHATADLDLEDLIPVEDMVVTVSHEGYVKRVLLEEYRTQRRGGRGKSGMSTKDTDFVEHLFVASTHSTMLFFTTSGRVFSRKVFHLPVGSRIARGKPIVNVLPFDGDEKLAMVLAIDEFKDGHYLFFGTAKGRVKKTNLMAYSNIRSTGIIAINLNEGDELIAVRQTTGQSDVILSTQSGMAIRFREDNVRSMGRDTAGVRGIDLQGDDRVVGCITFDREETDGQTTTLLTVTERGFGKRTVLDGYLRGGNTQSRGGKGLIDIQTDDRNGVVIGIIKVEDDTDQYLLVTDQGVIIRADAATVSLVSRNTKGVRMINLDDGARVVSIARYAAGDEQDNLDDAELEDGDEGSGDDADTSAGDED